MNALTEIIAAADQINIVRARRASDEAYRTWLGEGRETDWIVFSDAHQNFLTLDNIVRGLA